MAKRHTRQVVYANVGDPEPMAIVVKGAHPMDQKTVDALGAIMKAAYDKHAKTELPGPEPGEG